MSAFMAALLAMLPRVMLAILAKVATESFMQSVIERVLLAAMGYAVKLTTNTVDDEISEELRKRLQGPV